MESPPESVRFNPERIVAQTDIGRAGWVVRARRQLEGRKPSVRSRQSEDELLGGEMSRVAWIERLDVARVGHGERPSERRPDPRPRLERRGRAVATLDVGVARPADPDRVGKALLGQSPAPAGDSRFATERRSDRGRQGVAVDRSVGAPGARHDGASVTYRPSRAISCAVAPGRGPLSPFPALGDAGSDKMHHNGPGLGAYRLRTPGFDGGSVRGRSRRAPPAPRRPRGHAERRDRRRLAHANP